jgi:hypothetical protein
LVILGCSTCSTKNWDGWLMLFENQAPDQENNNWLLTTGFNHLGDVEKWTVEARSNHEPEETKPRMIMDVYQIIQIPLSMAVEPQFAGNLGSVNIICQHLGAAKATSPCKPPCPAHSAAYVPTCTWQPSQGCPAVPGHIPPVPQAATPFAVA